MLIRKRFHPIVCILHERMNNEKGGPQELGGDYDESCNHYTRDFLSRMSPCGGYVKCL